jgi:hypothetical protein
MGSERQAVFGIVSETVVESVSTVVSCGGGIDFGQGITILRCKLRRGVVFATITTRTDV